MEVSKTLFSVQQALGCSQAAVMAISREDRLSLKEQSEKRQFSENGRLFDASFHCVGPSR